MKQKLAGNGWQIRLAVLAVTIGWLAPAWGSEQNLIRTNWVDRRITNTIDIIMPRNIFVDEFHTNWSRQYLTNVVEIPVTNWVTRNVTNKIPVEATRTKSVTEYATNWETVFLTNVLHVDAVRTNYVDHWRTNWKTMTLTKEFAADAFRTNYVDQWHTNLRTLTITNWQTVLVMKTNYYSQPVTNVVEIDVASNRSTPASAAATPAPAAVPPATEAAPAPTTAASYDDLAIEVVRSEKASANNLMEVRLAAHSLSDPATPVHVQQWRVESVNGAILCYGQANEFKRELPVGKYKIEAKAQRGTDGPALFGRGTLTVSAAEAVMLATATAKH